MIRLWLGCERSRTIDLLLWLVAACLFAALLAINIAQGQQGPQKVSLETRTRFPVSSANLIAAMQRVQLPTQDVQVKMAAPITALSANPQLEVLSVTPVNTHEIRLRITCRDHGECLPFFATAVYPGEVASSALPERKESPDATASAASNTGHRANVIETADGPPILKAGSAATLDIDGDRVHIRVEVICLQNGSPGDKIRVTTRDHKQVYVAQIVTPTLLKGSL